MNASRISKKLINGADRCVDDALRGVVCLYPSLQLHADHRFISTFQDECCSKVAILSGGGSGHEPFCSGYVGDGMLSGAVAGSVFASPPKSHILHGINHLHRFNKGGVLVIIPNYTGDRLNFGMAVEKAKNDGLKVESLVVGEDCASDNGTSAGRRGMCGLLFTYKISGALAKEGHNLDDILEVLKDILKNLSTLGVTLRPCALPGQPPLFSIADDEMELGTGVHGEGGIEKLKLGTAQEAVHIVLEKLCSHLQLRNGSRVAVLINNLGSTSQIEQNILSAEVFEQLANRGMNVRRMYAGMLMTSLDMAGFQVSILNIPPGSETWLKLLDVETLAPEWVGKEYSKPSNDTRSHDVSIDQKQAIDEKKLNGITLELNEQQLFKRCLSGVAEALQLNENRLNELDSGCGDGDCGTTLRHLGDEILEILASLCVQSPSKVLLKLADVAECVMGGTTGAIYSIAFTAAAKVFSETRNGQGTPLCRLWAQSLSDGLDSIMKYGGAKPGDRTMLDALVPAVDVFIREMASGEGNMVSALKNAVEAAETGCKSTKTMIARAGRASYVNQSLLVDVDAGAFAVVVWISTIRKALE